MRLFVKRRPFPCVWFCEGPLYGYVSRLWLQMQSQKLEFSTNEPTVLIDDN